MLGTQDVGIEHDTVVVVISQQTVRSRYVRLFEADGIAVSVN